VPIPEIREHAIDWHGRILQAVADAHPALAREAMRGHLIQTEEDSERYLTADPGQASGIPETLPPATRTWGLPGEGPPPGALLEPGRQPAGRSGTWSARPEVARRHRGGRARQAPMCGIRWYPLMGRVIPPSVSPTRSCPDRGNRSRGSTTTVVLKVQRM